MTRHHTCYGLASAIVVLLSFENSALATDRTWGNASGGLFSQASNWTGGIIPGSSDRAFFNQGSTYTVTMTSSIFNDQLRVNNDTMTLNLGGSSSPYHLTNTGTSSLSIGGASGSPLTFPAFGRLTLTNGILNSVSTEVGIGTHGNGIITVSTGANWTNSGLLDLGVGTSGTLNIINGGDATTVLCTIGDSATGAATVSGAGSTWAVTTHLDVGGNTTGTLSILSGGRLSSGTSGSASIGAANGINGTATVDGTNSRWDQTGYFKVGDAATGTLNVQNGGTVNNTSTTQDSTIGDAFNSHGTANINAGSWTVQNRALSVGYNGAGTLNISNAGHVYLTNNDLNIAYSGISTGNVGITGANSGLNARSVFVGGFSGGQGGTGTLTLGSGTTLNVSNGGVLKVWPAGTVHLPAGGMINAGSLAVVSGGTFDWTGGTLDLTNMNFDVGPGGTLGSNVTIGAGKTLDLALSLRSGINGNGAFSVTSGAIMYSYDAAIGYSSTGSATIDGAGSQWICFHNYRIAQQGNGTLTISNGGDLESLGTGVTEFAGSIGDQAGRTGTATVTGTGSNWHAYGVQGTPTQFMVGNLGTGTLNINSGGVVAHEACDAIVAFDAASTGTVNVDGAGSRWTTDTFNLDIGRAGMGNLNVTNGGLAENPSGLCTLGGGFGGTGTAIIDGTNSRLTGFTMNVGYGGAGHATMRNGGTLTMNEIYISAAAGSSGDMTLDGPGSTIVATSGFGYLIPGSAATGSLTIQNGGFAHALETFIGDGSNATGTLILTGANSRLQSDSEIDVGFSGHGSLEIHSGATASTPVATIGHGSGSTGTALLDGPGSALNVSDHLELGGGTSGRLTVATGSTVTATNAIRVNSTGTLDLTGGSVTSAALTTTGGALIGEGMVSAALLNGGTVAPGHSAGTLTISGSYTQTSTGSLNVELGGLNAGSQFDQVVVSASASLAGTLSVARINGFRPIVGDQVQILTAGSVSGTFASLILSGFPNGTQATVLYGPTAATLRFTAVPGGCSTCRGDLTGDGLTDAADIQAFIGCLFINSMTGPCACADVNADGQVNAADAAALVGKLLGSASLICS